MECSHCSYGHCWEMPGGLASRDWGRSVLVSPVVLSSCDKSSQGVCTHVKRRQSRPRWSEPVQKKRRSCLSVKEDGVVMQLFPRSFRLLCSRRLVLLCKPQKFWADREREHDGGAVGMHSKENCVNLLSSALMWGMASRDWFSLTSLGLPRAFSVLTFDTEVYGIASASALSAES